MNNNPMPHRRRFIRHAALGAGVALFGVALPLTAARAAGNVDTLLLSCMDFRLMDDIERYMGDRGLRDNYDHIILAGASLGAVTDKYPAWNRTFWDHLEVAIQLHKVARLMVIDHRDCGAYKVILGADLHQTPARETDVHAEQLRKLRDSVGQKFPALTVELLLMDLQGKVETIS